MVEKGAILVVAYNLYGEIPQIEILAVLRFKNVVQLTLSLNQSSIVAVNVILHNLMSIL